MTTQQEDFELTMVDEPDMTVPEDTICKARLVDLNKRTWKWTDTKDKDHPGVPIEKTAEEMVWWFEITAGEYQGRRIRGTTRPNRDGEYLTNNPRNQTRPWAETLLGREIPIGQRIVRSDLVGCDCEISVKHTKDKKDPSKIYEEVEGVLPADGTFDFSSEPPF